MDFAERNTAMRATAAQQEDRVGGAGKTSEDPATIHVVHDENGIGRPNLRDIEQTRAVRDER